MMPVALIRRVRTHWPSIVTTLAGLVVWLGLTTAAARGVKVSTYYTSPNEPARTVRWYGWTVVDSNHPTLIDSPDEFVMFAFWGLCGIAALPVAVPAWKLAEVFRRDVQLAIDPTGDSE